MLDTFQAKWTEAIHTEWIRNVLKNRPDLKAEQLERTRQLMNAHTRDAVVGNYENLIDSLKLPDENDRHVLAAAIHAKAGLIVTFNLRDFPANELSHYGVEAIHPDNFIKRLIESDADLVFLAAQRQWKSLKNPPKPLAEFLKILASNGLDKTIEYLRLMFEKEL